MSMFLKMRAVFVILLVILAGACSPTAGNSQSPIQTSPTSLPQSPNDTDGVATAVSPSPIPATVEPSPSSEPTVPPTPTQTLLPTETPTTMPTERPSPTQTATTLPQPASSALVLTGPEISYEHVTLTLDAGVAPALYPSISEDGQQLTFLFAEGGYCVIEGCLMVTRIDLNQAWMAEMVPLVQTAVSDQDSSYTFTSRGAALILQSHTALLASNQLNGIRAVTYHTQNLPLINNRGLKYEYRGVTPDGLYFVHAFVPVSLPFLPDSGDPAQENQPHFAVPLPETLPGTMEELAPILHAYNDQVAVFVDEAAEDTFLPALNTIDAVINSITISPNP